MTKRGIQFFSDEYLQYCKQLSTEQIVQFLDDFRTSAYAGQKQKSVLISMKVPEDLLNAFKMEARRQGKPYQSLIKELMRKYLHGETTEVTL